MKTLLKIAIFAAFVQLGLTAILRKAAEPTLETIDSRSEMIQKEVDKALGKE